MNIHEYQAKDILNKFGARTPNGVVIFSLSEIDEKFKKIKTEKIVLKAQIKPQNLASIKCFSNCGFKLISKTDKLLDLARKYG